MKSKFPRFSPEWWEWMTMPEPNTGCILWMGHACSRGYGRIGYASTNANVRAKSPVLVHRIAYEQAHGPIGRQCVLHRCDTPSCVNPDHLFLGTQKDNMRDMFQKGRGRPMASGRRRVEFLQTVTAAVAVKELASKNYDAGVRMVDCIHPIRSGGMLEAWRQVTGVPDWAKNVDGPVCVWPLFRTAEPAKRDGVGYLASATVARVCGLPPYVSDPVTAQPARVGGVE